MKNLIILGAVLFAAPAFAADLPMSYSEPMAGQYEKCGFDVMTKTWGTQCNSGKDHGPKTTPTGTVRTAPTPPSDGCGPKGEQNASRGDHGYGHKSGDKGRGPRGESRGDHGKGHGKHH